MESPNKENDKIFNVSQILRLPILYFLTFLINASITTITFACDRDSDCRSGESCYKREKRARGICYPSVDQKSQKEPKVNRDEIELKAVTGEIRQRAIQWLGDPLEIIGENLPNKAIGKVCIVTSDCPSGSECVLAGFEGRCVEF